MRHLCYRLGVTLCSLMSMRGTDRYAREQPRADGQGHDRLSDYALSIPVSSDSRSVLIRPRKAWRSIQGPVRPGKGDAARDIPIAVAESYGPAGPSARGVLRRRLFDAGSGPRGLCDFGSRTQGVICVGLAAYYLVNFIHLFQLHGARLLRDGLADISGATSSRSGISCRIF